MRQAIITKYLGPTHCRGGRIKAKCDAKAIIIPWDHSLSVEDNHRLAAKTLAAELGWVAGWIGGCLPSDSPYNYCFVHGAKS